MPNFTVRGFQGVTLVKSAPQYNAQTKIYSFVTEYQGTEAAVRGLEAQLIADGLTYRTDHQGPVWSLFVEVPEQDIDENLDRWEVFTESTEKSLFEIPEVVTEAEGYDAGLSEGEPTYKQECESAASSVAALIEAEPNAFLVVRHLRAGVTGWQVDLIGLRRTRRLQAGSVASYQISLDTGLLIYSTSQLNVPPEVAFALPATPSDISDLFTWGWRKRSQRVEIIGSLVEQTVELLFAPWSTSLAYEVSTDNLDW